MFYRKQLPRDLWATFQRNDEEMVSHLIGHDQYKTAKDLGLTFQFITGTYNLNTQMIDTGIQVQGDDKKITIWLLQYNER
jgi:hypothetical protein